MATTNEEPFSIQCQGASDSITVIGFYTEDENKLCMISQEPMHQSCLDFCPDATLRQPFDKYNGIRLSCGHEFSAICLVWSWILNTMTCPCCRDGNADFSACLSNVHRRNRPVLRARKDALEKQERIEQVQSDAALVMQSWEDMDVETQLVEPVVMIALYFYGQEFMHNVVLELHRQGGGSGPDHARFSMQRSDLRSISRCIRHQPISAFRFVVFSHNETGMSCIMRSPNIVVAQSSAAINPTNNAVATETNMSTIGVLDSDVVLMPPVLMPPGVDTHTNEVHTTEHNSIAVSLRSGSVYDRRVSNSSNTTSLCVRTVALVGNVEIEFNSCVQHTYMDSLLKLAWNVPLQSLELIFPPTMFTVFQYNQ